MATKTATVSISASNYEEFGNLIMESIGNITNFSVSFDGKEAKCDEITAPMVGMGFNKWQRGRAYSVITFSPTAKQATVTTEIKGLTGAAFNSKFADEICQMLTSKIRFANSKLNAQSASSHASMADELLKFKQLLDAGVISQEEFDAKKKQILG